MKHFLALILINLNFVFSFIKLPFRTHEIDHIDYLYNNYIYINLDIGIPPQNNTKLVIKQGKYSFYIYDSDTYSNISYIKKSSTKYRAFVDEKFELTTSNCKKGISSMDTFFFQNIKIDNFTFILCIKSKNEEYLFFEGEIGLNLEYQSPPNTNFIQSLKNNEIINSYIYSIYYINDKEGFLLIGEYPHRINFNNNLYNQYSDIKENNLVWIHSQIGKNNFHWTILFDKISYGNTNIYQAQREARILIETKYIKSTNQYYNLFNDIFGKKCTTISLDEDLQGFKCSKDIHKELTPEIKFYNKELNVTFLLDYNDLFIEKGNYLYFLVVNDLDYVPDYWVLGKPFLKKYLFLFNYDTKMIGFYKAKDRIKVNHKKMINSYTLSITFNIFLVIIVIALIFIFYHYYFKKRRIRANELEDRFNYISQKDK